MKRLAASLCVLIVLGLAGMFPAAHVAGAQQIATFGGPQDNSQLFAYLNTLVNSINAITGPLLPTVTGGVNAISLTAGTTGNPAVIGLQSTADTNGGININPNGSGNISLFGSADTGVLQLANSASFVAATGLANCPAVVAKKAPIGISDTVQGYYLIQDWLGRSHGVPAC